MSKLIPRSERGFFTFQPQEYGRSVLNAPLLYFPAQQVSEHSGLFIAGTHGDETASVALLSSALRSIYPTHLKHHIILSVNPDGNQLGVRSNANGVDLNRNFPSSDWSENGTVYRWTSATDKRDVNLSSGNKHMVEPETEALIRLIDTLHPAFVISFHEPLACIDSTMPSHLAEKLSADFDLPLVNNIGYATNGSFGTWCDEKKLANITVELPPISADRALETYLNVLVNLMTSNARYD